MTRGGAERAPSSGKRSLDGRVAIVTGASRGIGAGIAASLIAAGARVLGASRTRARDVEFAQIECDVTAPDAPARIVHAALERYGHIDALVNNAGVLLEAPCWEQGDADVDELLAVNLTAPFRLARAVAAHWVAREAPGAIVNVCSIESQVGSARPPHALYSASKGGLLALTRAQALEWAEHGIRVVAVGPGAVATAMTPEDSELVGSVPLGGRPGTAGEVGEVVAFLLSDAASYVTGEIVYVDGGYLLR